MWGGGGRATASTTVTVQVPAEAATAQGQEAAAPERQLIRFLHFLALVERTGNALGTLAFTWATVVLLGGYPTVLSNVDNVLIGDFEAATVIFFLEATRFLHDN
uniref:Uncharacterized protein n=1 Tax=Avena sativa TaxID=4498 RepID=A0ACD5U188_AVESA